ncbi:MAG: hypothetical protein IT384_15855 [Deltaproteobacteria bacterium]|nr:hypothetical protein [Deltaproteobacteria bacterium]
MVPGVAGGGSKTSPICDALVAEDTVIGAAPAIRLDGGTILDADQTAACAGRTGCAPIDRPKVDPPKVASPLTRVQRLARPVAAVILGAFLGLSALAGAPLETKAASAGRNEPIAVGALETAKTHKTQATPRIVAREDPSLGARVLARSPLAYADGADALLDRPAHVRAGSGIAWFGARLAIVQDDTHFVVLHDPQSGRTESIALPRGQDGRRVFDDQIGNKKLKLDLEAIVALESARAPMAVAFGSGSAEKRETIVLLTTGEQNAPVANAIPAKRFYAALRELRAFSGSELNIEAAVDLGNGNLRLFQRGNGKAKDGLEPVNATVDVSTRELLAYLQDPDRAPLPELTNPVQYDLGAVGGVRLTFGDAVRVKGGILFLAAAEDSPDAVQDGAVSATVLGFIDANGVARWTHITGENGRPLLAKPEGITFDKAHPGRVYLVTDTDDVSVPAELLTVRVRGIDLSE